MSDSFFFSYGDKIMFSTGLLVFLNFQVFVSVFNGFLVTTPLSVLFQVFARALDLMTTSMLRGHMTASWCKLKRLVYHERAFAADKSKEERSVDVMRFVLYLQPPQPV